MFKDQLRLSSGSSKKKHSELALILTALASSALRDSQNSLKADSNSLSVALTNFLHIFSTYAAVKDSSPTYCGVKISHTIGIGRNAGGLLISLSGTANLAYSIALSFITLLTRTPQEDLPYGNRKRRQQKETSHTLKQIENTCLASNRP